MTVEPFRNHELDVETRVEDLLQRLTPHEKFSCCVGKDFWTIKPVKRLGMPTFGMTDGPHGVAPHSSNWKRATYFPTSIAMGATWNPSIAHEFGAALGRETRAAGRHVILGPGINIHRTPLCGRTFEYLTEDPFLNKSMVVPIVKGIQEQRIAACVKHYACNNQENHRMTVDAVVPERALQEIYLPGFKAAVEDAGAWSVMSCYNKVNGIYGSENKDLLTGRLRTQWGFTGFVVSDWYATARTTDTAACANAGLSVEMPGGILAPRKKFTPGGFRSALKKGTISMDAIDENVRRVLRVMIRVGLFDPPGMVPPGAINTPEHHAIARKIAEEGMVLLKNEGGLLPLDIQRIKRIAITGPNAHKKQTRALPFIGTGGSSEVLPFYEVTPLQGIKEKIKDEIQFTDDVERADFVVVVAGLNHVLGNDSEGTDRKHLALPSDQVKLIQDVASKNPKTIVVLVNGSPVSMDGWIDRVPAVLEAWYGGQECGRVIADILFGDVNPSGKLPVTFPKRIEDSPAHANVPRTYPGDASGKVYYDEGIFIGYRHFDTRNIAPLFPFGYGLSYTTFEFSDLKIDKASITGNESITVSFDVKNTGTILGAEVAQVYVKDDQSSVERPLKELKGFKKVRLDAGKKERISIELGTDSLSFYDETRGSWIVEAGRFTILVGSSSRDIQLEGKIEYSP